jgi:hypothetical protein
MTDLIVAGVSVPAQTKFTVTQIDGNYPARLQEWGARYHDQNDFVRYRISDLDLWMSSRADEIRPDLSTATLGAAKNRGIKS